MNTLSHKNQALMSEINIIPFVDIILVILIIFLIVSPTFIRPGFNIQLPKAESAKKPQNVQALLSIDIEGRVYLNREVLSQEKLNRKLRALLQKNPDMKAVISADKNVAHGNVVSLIDELRKAGVKQFAVSVEAMK